MPSRATPRHRGSSERATLSSRIGRAKKHPAGRKSAPSTPLDLRVADLGGGSAVEDYVRQRVGFKLGKFDGRVSRVVVRLSDESRSAGRPTLACTVKVVLAASPSVVVEVRDPDARAAIDTALDRTERAVRMALDGAH